MAKTQLPYDVENKVESFHWWFVVRRKLLRSILSSIRLPKNSNTLDIGCGSGSNLREIGSAELNGIGLDQSTYALSLVRRKGQFPLLAGDVNHLPLKAESVGLIIAMDVFEHLEDDVNGIHECYRALVHGGVMIVTVPAFESLWGTQDVVTGHKRRYSKKDIARKLREARFDILKSSYFNFFLFFPILLARRIVRLLGLKIKSENELNLSWINFFLKSIFLLELQALKYFSFPFGVSILFIVRK